MPAIAERLAWHAGRSRGTRLVEGARDEARPNRGWVRPDDGGDEMSTQGTVRIAVVGAGAMASRVHYPSLAALDDVEIAGVCDIDEARLANVADRYGIEGRFGDYREMIEKLAPDGVYVIGPPDVMYPIWIWCLAQGCNLYIEKPMGITIHQAEMLAHLAEDHRVITQVSHQRRSAPIMQKVREEVVARGPMTHAVCEFYKFEPRPLVVALDHIMGDGTHAIDTLRWMCGGEVVDVDFRYQRIGTPDVNWIAATLAFDNGAVGYLLSSWAVGRRVFRVEMHAPGISADVELEDKAHVYADGNYEGVTYDSREVAGSDEFYVYGGFLAKNREFIESLRTGRDVTTSPFRDCLKTMQVAEALRARAAKF